MPRKRKSIEENTIKVRITGYGCQIGDRPFQPGETANIPTDIALEWIEAGRAVDVSAEVKQWQPDEP